MSSHRAPHQSLCCSLEFADMKKRLVHHRLSKRAVVILFVHAIAFAAAYWLSFASVSESFSIPSERYQRFFISLPILLAIKLVIFYVMGHCHRTWRHATFSDLAALLRAATLSSIVFATVALMIQTPRSRSILALDWAMTILILGGMRAGWRLSHEEIRPFFSRRNARKALIVGANHSGELLARHFARDPGSTFVTVGFLDDDKSRYGSTIGGVRVLGSPDDATQIAVDHGVDDVLVISGTLLGSRLRALMESCKKAELDLKIIPDIQNLITGDYSPQIRDVDINDLLRRSPVELDSESIRKLIEDHTVMVTGAGGSIGSEICRQALRFGARSLILVERAENNLFLIERNLAERDGDVQIIPCLADISDDERMEQVFGQHRPQVVFHAAAHKHVPLMESNPGEAIKNNVLGTMKICELAERYGVDECVVVSTDKAVNPTSIMGVSKQLAERFVYAFSGQANTKFVLVRFGNVLASTGSVVPLFQEQIRRGGPITVTHPDIERYFMTIPEASQLVLQAAAMGRGGEIYVLDMGESIKIVDLAYDMVRLSGLNPDDIEIEFSGMRPGEKLYEELYCDDEEMLPTSHPKVFAAYHRPYDPNEVRVEIGELLECVHDGSETLTQKLKQLVPEYQSSEMENKTQETNKQKQWGEGVESAN